ncbi:SDR family NAD(P)-dependent oxidoreductase [Oerskovia paurometabola]|uniref:SDR family NAD(P)-dependent oxidoreductase n=1 Tax=Oerskovia paurometabola TaxID=162170 RepID=UPI003437928F
MSTSTIPNRFSGATVVVTGAGSGIGKATATRLLAEGARVIASDLDADRLAALVAESGEAPLLTIVGDVSDDAVIASIVEAGEGRITGLVNNAGIMDSFVPTAEIDDTLWERVMRINVTAPMKLMRAVLPAMVEAGHGRIVNVASEASVRAGASGTPYATSKHAVVGLTKSTALFYGPAGVRVNAVAPGAVATNIEAPFRSELGAKRLGPIMQATVPEPATAEQLAASITWLLSEDSANVNGVLLMSDGGWSTI